jgi:hypothetical protein
MIYFSAPFARGPLAIYRPSVCVPFSVSIYLLAYESNWHATRFHLLFISLRRSLLFASLNKLGIRNLENGMIDHYYMLIKNCQKMYSRFFLI